MTDFLGYGKEKRREGNLDILAGRVTFRYVCSARHAIQDLTYRNRSDAFREMLESVNKNGHTFEECKQVLRDSASVRSPPCPSLTARRHQARFRLQGVLSLLQVAGHPADHRIEVRIYTRECSRSRCRPAVPCPHSGMEPIIRALLTNLVGEEASYIDIISNSVDVHADGSWDIKYRHPSR